MKIRADINSGGALILFIASFFCLVAGVALSSAIERIFAVALAGLTGSFGGYLVKRNSRDKIELSKSRICDDPDRNGESSNSQEAK